MATQNKIVDEVDRVINILSMNERRDVNDWAYSR